MTTPSHRARLGLLLCLALWLALTLSWLLGARSLVLRDVLFVHRPLKSFGAAELARGRVPAFNPTLGLGQPFRGNPNALPLYPGNLAYLALPFETAFHLHFALHWLVGFLGVRRLAKELGQSEHAALLAAVAWAGSGYALTLLSFYNLVAVAAWAPWLLWAVARATPSSLGAGGAACGLMLLAGEPVTALATLAFVPLVAHASAGGEPRPAPRRRWATAAGVWALGLAIALPQIVAVARTAPYSFRVAHGLEAAEVGWQSLHPLRLLELVLPLPWGWPSDYARFGYWSNRVVPDIPFVYSIHVGVIGFALALSAVRRRPGWAALAALFLGGAMAAGLAPGALAAVTGGLVRYPQRLVFGFTLAAALLAGWGLDAARAAPAVGRRFALAGLALAALATLGGVRFDSWVGFLREQFAEGGKVRLATTHAAAWIVAAALAALLLAAAGWALGRRATAGVVALQLLGLAQLAPILVTVSSGALAAEPPFQARLEAKVGAADRRAATPYAVVSAIDYEPAWDPRPPYPLAVLNPAGQALVDRFNLQPALGVADGLTYPLAEDVDGLSTPLSVFLGRNLERARWHERAAWAARLGARWIVRFGEDEPAPLRRVAVERQFGVATELLEVPDPAPVVRWPQAVAVAASPGEAYALVARGAVPATTAVASRALEHVPGARVELVRREPDRFTIDVDGGGGLLVVGTAYHPVWRARLEDGRRLPTQPADLLLLGVELPPGRHRLELDVAARAEAAAGVVGVAAMLVALVLAGRGRLGAGRSAGHPSPPDSHPGRVFG